MGWLFSKLSGVLVREAKKSDFASQIIMNMYCSYSDTRSILDAVANPRQRNSSDRQETVHAVSIRLRCTEANPVWGQLVIP